MGWLAFPPRRAQDGTDMPFHMGGHKPKPPTRKVEFRIGYRLVVACLGAYMTLNGVVALNRGRFMWMDHRHQPAYAGALIAMGVVVALVALIPMPWVDKAAKRLTGARPKRHA
jgi:hypothetical protein